MPKNREDEKLRQDAIDDDLESLEELLKDTYLSALGVSRRPRVEVSLELLLKGTKKGYTIDELVDDLDDYVVAAYLSVLLAAGANPDKLASRLRGEDLVKYLDELLNAGAKIDIDSLIAKLNHDYIVGHLAELLAAGANPDKLVSCLRDEDVVKHLDELLDAGAKIDVDKLVDKIPNKSEVIWALPKVVAAGADKAKLGRRLGELLDDGCYLYDFLGNLDAIRESEMDGVTPDRLMQRLEERGIGGLGIRPFYIADKLDALLRFGVDPNRLARLADGRPFLLDDDAWQWGDKLRAAGADPELLQPRPGR